MKILKTIQKLFKKSRATYWNGNYQVTQPTINFTSTEQLTSYATSSDKQVVDPRIAKKPLEVFEEILSEGPQIDLSNLDEKIAMVKERGDLLKRHLGREAIDEKLALGYLQARKKLVNNKKEFTWLITTDEKVKALCEKYQLRVVGFSGYCKNVPTEGLKEMENYIKAWEKVRYDEPEFSLIIDDGGEEEKKDPILLVTSPFGRWYYVLGAWDKEILYVDDIIYHAK